MSIEVEFSRPATGPPHLVLVNFRKNEHKDAETFACLALKPKIDFHTPISSTRVAASVLQSAALEIGPAEKVSCRLSTASIWQIYPDARWSNFWRHWWCACHLSEGHQTSNIRSRCNSSRPHRDKLMRLQVQKNSGRCQPLHSPTDKSKSIQIQSSIVC